MTTYFNTYASGTTSSSTGTIYVTYEPVTYEPSAESPKPKDNKSPEEKWLRQRVKEICDLAPQ